MGKWSSSRNDGGRGGQWREVTTTDGELLVNLVWVNNRGLLPSPAIFFSFIKMSIYLTVI